MSRSRICTLVVLGAILALLTSAASADAKPAPVTFAGCDRPVVRPMDVVLACGDGTESFLVKRWSRWTRTGARAVGSAEINDCTPNCATGHEHSSLAALVLDRPRTCHGRLRLTRLRLVFAEPPSRGQPAAVIYPCR